MQPLQALVLDPGQNCSIAQAKGFCGGELANYRNFIHAGCFQAKEGSDSEPEPEAEPAEPVEPESKLIPNGRQPLDRIPIFAGSAISVLLFTMLLLDWQVRFGVTQRAMTELLLMLAAILPAGNHVPTYRGALKIVTDTSIKPSTRSMVNRII
jgi:hypothetical protein